MRLEHESREWSRIDAAVFRTITSADWRRAVLEARAAGNAVRDRIRNRFLSLGLGKSAAVEASQETNNREKS